VDVDAERTRLLDNPGHVRAAAGELLPPAALAGPDHDLGDLMLLREGGDGPGGILARYLVPAGADVGGQLLQLLDGPAIPRAGGVAAGHVEDVEFSLEPGGHPGRPAQQAAGPGSRGDGHHDALASLPHDLGVVPPQVLQQVLVGLVGQEPQGELPQGGQVVDAEEVGQGQRDPFLRIDVSVQHAAPELLGRRVDQLDLIRLAHDPIRDTFTDPRPRHVLDLVGDALQVLDVDGRDDVDPRGEDFQDILPPFAVLARSRHVRMGQLVDQGELGAPAQYRVEVHFLQSASPVVHLLAGNHLQAVDHVLGQLPSVTLDESDDDIGTPAQPPVALAEHGVGLADARGRAQVNPEAPGRLYHPGGICRFASRRVVVHGSSLAADKRPGQQEVAWSPGLRAWRSLGIRVSHRARCSVRSRHDT
jgi:hypothetical protein